MQTHFPDTFMKLSTMMVMGRASTKTPLMIAPLAMSFPAENRVQPWFEDISYGLWQARSHHILL